jgi:GT2 family glycosyltransferase
VKQTVSVIIPVYNDSERLKLCLEALERQSYPRKLYKVIVVNNHPAESLDGPVARFSQAILIRESLPGSYRARNRGLSRARGEVIAFTDSDCIPNRDWLEKGVAALLEVPNCGLVGGKIQIFFRDPEHPTAVELYQMITAFPQQRYIEADKYGATANLFTFRSVIDQVGFFDDTLESGGDVEWGRRVFSAGYKLVYADDCRVAHPARRSLKELHQMFARVTGGHLELRRRRQFFFSEFTRRRIRNFRSPFRRFCDLCRDQRVRGLKRKIKVLSVMVMIRCFGMMEIIKLRLGIKSEK